jgi:putative PIN family toxin of toxin-antitoxin system
MTIETSDTVSLRAVVDTNILIRAYIKPEGTVGPVLHRLRLGDYVLICSIPLFDELLAKLALPRIRVKYSVTDEDLEALTDLITLRALWVTPIRQVQVCRDPDDDMVIEAALAGQANYVVTGDKDLLTLGQFEGIRFVPAHAFLAALGA